MADHVNPLGGLTPGLHVAQSPATPRPVAEKTPPAKTSDVQPQRQDGQTSDKAVASAETAAAQLNSHLQQTATELKFQEDKDTGRTTFKIVNKNTGEVLLQVPSEEVLAMARNLQALDSKMTASGVLVDKKG
jgi:flagellar protein FlaG